MRRTTLLFCFVLAACGDRSGGDFASCFPAGDGGAP